MSIVGVPSSLGECDTDLVANDMMDLEEEDDVTWITSQLYSQRLSILEILQFSNTIYSLVVVWEVE